MYSCGTVIKQFVGTFEIGGRNVTADDLEWKLFQLKVVNSELEEDPSKVQDAASFLRGQM